MDDRQAWRMRVFAATWLGYAGYYFARKPFSMVKGDMDDALHLGPVALVGLVTGILSLGVYPVSESYALLARVGLYGLTATVALYGAAGLDLALGIGTLVLRRRLWLWRAQIALIAAYSLIIAFALPE